MSSTEHWLFVSQRELDRVSVAGLTAAAASGFRDGLKLRPLSSWIQRWINPTISQTLKGEIYAKTKKMQNVQFSEERENTSTLLAPRWKVFANKEPTWAGRDGCGWCFLFFLFLQIKNQGKGWLRVVFPTVKINQGPRPLNKSGKRRPGQSGISIELPSFPTCSSQRTDRSFFPLKTARSRTSGHLSEDEPK